jgi:hypothetical protein
VLERGQIRQRSLERPREQVVFDYALVTTGGEPRIHRKDVVTVVLGATAPVRP